MQMLEWVLSLPLVLAASSLYSIIEMGSPCCVVISEDSGCFTSTRNFNPTECSTHFPPSFRSEPPKLPETLSALKAA